MTAILVGVLLLLSLFIAEQYTRSHPLSSWRPLNVDQGLPLPWAGHASTVCSLTALFGAYLAIFLLVGPFAILGVALGSIGALFFMRRVVRTSGIQSFEEFLSSRRFSTKFTTNELCWVALVGTQVAYATSELLLLREIAFHGIRFTPSDATAFALGIALVGYLYCLRGGYHGVFRTDVVQFVFVIGMCAVVGSVGLTLGLPRDTSTVRAFWNPPLGGMALTIAYQVVLGAAMGSAFLVASPDTWKRVFVTSAHTRSRRDFAILVAAGALPFVLLSPVILTLSPTAVSAQPWAFVTSLTSEPMVSVAFVLGLSAAFLSSFDSALVTATHVLLIRSPRTNTLPAYRLRFGGLFLTTVCLFLALSASIGNPYAVGAVLIGPYAVLGGTVIGTKGLAMPAKDMFWIVCVGLLGWFLYACSQPEVFAAPSVEQMHLVPAGVLLFGVFVVVSRVFRSPS